MKKPNHPRRASACPGISTSRFRRTLKSRTGLDDAAHDRIAGSRATLTTNGNALPTSAAATDPAVPLSTIALQQKPGSAALLELLGHTPFCAKLSRAGLVACCDCRRGPMQDPAIVVGVVMHYAKLALSQRAALPTVIVELLTHHVEAGDPACIMVADFLDRSGILDLPVASALRRRIRS